MVRFMVRIINQIIVAVLQHIAPGFPPIGNVFSPLTPYFGLLTVLLVPFKKKIENRKYKIK